MMKKYIPFLCCLLLAACSEHQPVNVVELTDNDPTTHYVGTKQVNRIFFERPCSSPVRSYKLISSGERSEFDPIRWTLKGSFDGDKWIVLDEQKEQYFCSRFQEIHCSVEQPSNYKQYLLEASSLHGDTLMLGDVQFCEDNRIADWTEFSYPAIDFQQLAPQTDGAAMYNQLVQNVDQYIRYHAQKVAEVLFYSAADSMNDVQTIRYILEDYKGVSAKSGNPPAVSIVYSTQHIEKSATESLAKLDYETRGVLFHELVHAYQFEPKGIGSYSTNREFWACIEGMADAVRAEAGFFDVNALRKPGGHWLDGYKTTGFFIQWLTTKDPNAIRKLHETVRDLDVWSFDKAMRSVFGDENGIEQLWYEYQMAISVNNA